MAKSHASINRWIREQEVRLGIGVVPSVGGNLPTVTVYPSPYVIERMAHAGADLLIANNPAYDAMCARLDAELAEIIDGRVGLAAPRVRRAKSTRAPDVPRIMEND